MAVFTAELELESNVNQTSIRDIPRPLSNYSFVKPTVSFMFKLF